MRIPRERQPPDDAIPVLGHEDGGVGVALDRPEVAPLVGDGSPRSGAEDPPALLAADAAANRARGVTFSETRYDALREWKTFAATDGSFTEQTITHVGAGVEANAIEGDEHQRRSYPDADGGPFKAAGFEYVRGLDLETRAEAIGEEAVALLSAPQCPSGRFTMVLDPSQLYMQIHESCGHPSELDRVYGTEASYAGTSFLTTDKLDEGFRYGTDAAATPSSSQPNVPMPPGAVASATMSMRSEP